MACEAQLATGGRAPALRAHRLLLVRVGHEHRAERVAVELVVVRPATRALVLPVTAERGGHCSSGPGRIYALIEDELSLVDERFSRHAAPIVGVATSRVPCAG